MSSHIVVVYRALHQAALRAEERGEDDAATDMRDALCSLRLNVMTDEERALLTKERA